MRSERFIPSRSSKNALVRVCGGTPLAATLAGLLGLVSSPVVAQTNAAATASTDPAPIVEDGEQAEAEGDGADPSPLQVQETPDVAVSADKKRPVPDYDGRGERPTTLGEALLWVPRVAAFPLYAVSEYVIRMPLGALVTTAEEDHWLAALADFFTLTESHDTGVIPTALIESDLLPSVGFYFFSNDVFTEDHDVRVRASFWPWDWYSLAAVERFNSADGRRRLELAGSLTIRPDYVYHGLGPDSRNADEANYSAQTYEAMARFDSRIGHASHLEWEMGVRHRDFDQDSSYAEGTATPSLREALADPATGIQTLPPGFAEGYSIYRQALALSVDSREPYPAPGDGMRLQLRGEHAVSLNDPVARRWVNYGAALGGFYDVSHYRVVSLSMWTHFADPLAGQVPFTDLAMLGGPAPMQGFALGRLHGRSSAAVLLEYRWPVWMWADAVLHYAMGNVFGAHLADFDVDKLRASFGFAIRAARAIDAPDNVLQLFFALGTDTIERGLSLENARVSIGASRGF